MNEDQLLFEQFFTEALEHKSIQRGITRERGGEKEGQESQQSSLLSLWTQE